MPLFNIIFSKCTDIVGQIVTRSDQNKGTVAIVLLSCLVLYVKERLLKPPKHLRHIPLRWSVYDTLKALLITRASLVDQKETQIMPYVNSVSGEDAYLVTIL
jgi:hypothetical protein